MIKIKRIQKIQSIENLIKPQYNIIFYGDTIDDRTQYIKSYILKNPDPVLLFKLKWDNKNKKIIENNSTITIDEFQNKISEIGISKAMVDSTSLDFPEIVYILSALKNKKNIEIDFIYAEPDDYKQKTSTSPEETDFELSSSQSIFSGLPKFFISNSSLRVSIIAPLGFEPMRLGQLLNTDEGANYESINGLFGIPAYKPGWENRSIKSHLRHFKKDISSAISLYPSSNPYEIYKNLSKIKDAYQRVILAPLGTKPSTIALALFLVNNFDQNSRKENVSAVYDFPQKVSKRTNGIGKIYIYNLYT